MSTTNPESAGNDPMWHEDDPDSSLGPVERPRATGPKWGAVKRQRKIDSGIDEALYL